MKNELYTNNSKKLIIGVSILFCAVILIIGATTAYFTQSDSKEIGNVVSKDINGSLEYSDNVDYMLGNLIPINVGDVDKAYTRENDLKCRDDNGYNVCSIYNFTITNNIDVSQNIIIDLYPVVNSFYNLRFNLYDITNNELLISNKELKHDDNTNITLESLMLNNSNNKSNTYELVFYIENKPEEDQTTLDAGKTFGATIKVNSITTGYNVVKDLGTGCWKADENDSTILSEFTGFNENNEVIKECQEYMHKDTDGYYIVNVPSTYGGYTFKSLGNNLFNAADEYYIDEETGEEIINFNEYSKIKNITISEGIEEIEDGIEDDSSLGFASPFFAVGFDIKNEDIKLDVTLPNSLTKIGAFAFYISNLSSVNIPDNVETIGEFAFGGTQLTQLTISKSVEVIGNYSFIGVPLTNVNFEVDENGSSNLKTIGEVAFGGTQLTEVKIPYGVTSIRQGAFSQNLKLTSLTFLGDLEDTTNELTIENKAFEGTDLTYTDINNPLIIPARVKNIGHAAFGETIAGGRTLPNLHYIKYMGDKETFDNFGDSWYNSYYVKYVKPKDEY